MSEATTTTAAKKKTATVYLDNVSEKLIHQKKGTSKAGKPYDFISVSISGLDQSDNGWGNFILGKYDKVLDARNKSGQILEGKKTVALNSSDSWKYRVSVKKGNGYQNIDMTAKEIKEIYDKSRQEYFDSLPKENASEDAAGEVTETPADTSDDFLDIPEDADGVLFS